MRKFPIALALLAAACGSSNKAKPDGAGIDDAPNGPPLAVVVAGDYMMNSPGTLAVVNLDTQAVTHPAPAGSVDDDPMIRHFGSDLYIVNRDLANITILDATTFTLIDQISTGTGSNPQDVAVVGNTLYVPVFAGKGVAVLTRGSQTMTTIDLSADDPDGKPNCNSAYVVGTNVYVSCELLDDTMPSTLPPRGPGKVYVIDSTTNTVSTTVTMQNDNPFGIFQPLTSGDLSIPTVNFDSPTGDAGCVEKITTSGTPASGGCTANNTQLNGYASGISIAPQPSGDSVMFLAVSDYPSANLQGFDLGTSTLWPAPISASSELVESVASCPDGEVVATDGTMATPGVRIYSGTAEKTTAPIDIGAPTANANAIVCY
ncbi:MAG TPA: hypothetical protein VMJ10_05750 [Kofleriaceae bacterium]|nr:hypothetical protein [Kofleriaceae bacterium]